MREQLPVEDLEELANEDIGEALRRTRVHYGKSLKDVEKVLRIRSSQIDAMERGDMTMLPGRVYAIGFVRSYAEFLDIDGDKVVKLFKAQYMDGQDKSDLSFTVPASETKTPKLWLVIASLICAVLLLVLWTQYGKQEQRIDVLSLERVPDDIKNHVNDDILSASVIDENFIQPDPLAVDIKSEPVVENMSSEEPQGQGIILNIIGNSWVEIKNGNGEVIVSNILETGDQYFVPDSPELSMSLGNAANVEIVVDGRALKPLGKEGDVRRDIPLNMAYLKTLEFVVISEDVVVDEIVIDENEE